MSTPENHTLIQPMKWTQLEVTQNVIKTAKGFLRGLLLQCSAAWLRRPHSRDALHRPARCGSTYSVSVRRRTALLNVRRLQPGTQLMSAVPTWVGRRRWGTRQARWMAPSGGKSSGPSCQDGVSSSGESGAPSGARKLRRRSSQAHRASDVNVTAATLLHVRSRRAAPNVRRLPSRHGGQRYDGCTPAPRLANPVRCTPRVRSALQFSHVDVHGAFLDNVSDCAIEIGVPNELLIFRRRCPSL
jgi:hypothetical protein